MGRAYLDYDGKKWSKVDKSDFWLDEELYKKLVNLKKIQSKGWDGVIIVDGKERSGKSTLGMACGWFMSNKQLTEKNFATGLGDVTKKIVNLPDKSVIILDEGSLMFSSKDYANKAQRQLIKILDVVGQKNLIFIICLPCFFDLNKTIAVRRSLFLLHVYPTKDYQRGSYAFWGEKKKGKLYVVGKKNYDSYAFPKAEFVGQYPNFQPPFYEKYLEEVKKKSLQEALDGGGDTSTVMMVRLGRAAIKLMEKYELNTVQIAEIYDVTRQAVQQYIKRAKKESEDLNEMSKETPPILSEQARVGKLQPSMEVMDGE